MNVLLISNCPLAHDQGSGYVVLQVSEGLKKLGHGVDTFGPESYEPIKKKSFGKSYKVALGMLFFCIRKILTRNYDVVIFYGAEAWLVLIFFKLFLRRKTLMISNSNGFETRYMDVMETFFGTVSYNNKARKWYQLDQRRLYRQAFFLSDGIITNNEKDRVYAIDQGYKDKHHVVSVDLGIEDEFFNITPTFENSKTLIFCGSWIKRKGIDLLCQDVGQILQDFPEYKLILVGVGIHFKIEEFFKREISDRIIVYPQIKTKRELIAVYSSGAIFVLPSVHESFGLVMCEAMACGCALVASDTGFAAGLNQDEAVIIQSIKSPDLYNAVKYLIQNEEVRKKIAANGFRRVQVLRWDLAVKKMETAYLSWILEKQNSKN